MDGPGWCQSNCPKGAARTVTVTGPSGKTVRYCLIDDEEALVRAANLGAIEFHPFLARADAPERPRALSRRGSRPSFPRSSPTRPLRWEELEEPRALAFTPARALERLRREGDLFRPVLELRQPLPA